MVIPFCYYFGPIDCDCCRAHAVIVYTGQVNVNLKVLRIDRALRTAYNTHMTLSEGLEKLASALVEKQAAGRMMEVAFHNLKQDSEYKIKTTRGIVYMPDCEKYRNIIKNGTPQEHAALVQKFMLNLGSGIHFASCDAYIVGEKQK